MTYYHYHYRYYYAVFTVFMLLAIAYLLDIQSLLGTYQTLCRNKRIIEQRLIQLKQSQPTSVYTKINLSQQTILILMTTLAAEHNVQIKMITWLPSPLMDTLKIHLTVLATPVALAEFLTALDTVDFPVWLQDFSYHINVSAINEGLFDADFFVLKYKHFNQPVMNHLTVNSSLFCGPSLFAMQSMLPQLDLYSLSNVKMVGYIARGKQQAVWVKLPDERMVPLNIGDKLGKEHAVVTQLDAKHVYLQSANHQQFIITMQ